MNGKPLNDAHSVIVRVNNLCPAKGNPKCAQSGLSGTNSLGMCRVSPDPIESSPLISPRYERALRFVRRRRYNVELIWRVGYLVGHGDRKESRLLKVRFLWSANCYSSSSSDLKFLLKRLHHPTVLRLPIHREVEYRMIWASVAPLKQCTHATEFSIFSI